jgi:hypothetical protein
MIHEAPTSSKTNFPTYSTDNEHCREIIAKFEAETRTAGFG